MESLSVVDEIEDLLIGCQSRSNNDNNDNSNSPDVYDGRNHSFIMNHIIEPVLNQTTTLGSDDIESKTADAD